MVYEVVTQHVDPQHVDDHIATWTKAWKEASFDGSHAVKFLRCVEDPGKVVLLIEWDSVEAHQGHRGTPLHNTFREASGRYTSGASEISHFTVQDM